MALHDEVVKLRQRRGPLPEELKGVSKDRIRAVMGALDLGTNADLIDCTFALLDDETDSWFAKAPDGSKISSGASTAHLACHIGILQRGGGKLDREGRDYWIKPLREIGGFEAITLQDGEFIAGHPVAKSPNSAYRIEAGLLAILQAPEDQWRGLLSEWAMAERCGKAGVGFTTTYRTWKEAPARQGAHQNVAVDTYIWIQADPAKQFKVEG